MSDPAVMTVTGRRSMTDVTAILPHEHTFIRLWTPRGRYDGARQVEDVETLAAELDVVAPSNDGLTLLVDLTTPDLGRRPGSLQTLSERTGVPIVMGCGWYREPYYEPRDDLNRRSVEDLAGSLEAEIRLGVDGVRPGVIGEIGVDRWYVSALEERVHRAAGRAQVRTGLPIALHGLFSDVGLAQLRILDDEGVDLARVAVAHVDRHPYPEYALEIARRGAFISLDNLGDASTGYEKRVIDLMRILAEAGYGDRILLSHDISKDYQLRSRGGHGFGYLEAAFVPTLRAAGFDDAEISGFRRDNPRRWLVGTP